MYARSSLVLAAALLLVPAAHRPITAQSAPATRPALIVEFPPVDSQIASQEVTATLAKERADLTGEAGETVRAVEYLLGKRRIAEALDRAALIVEKHPDRMASAVQVVTAFYFMGDESQVLTAKAPALVATSRAHLTGLSKDAAAEAVYRILALERRLAPRNDTSYLDRLKAFAQEYAGTDVALEAEVDLANNYQVQLPIRIAALESFVRGHPGTCAAARALHQQAFDMGANMSKPKEDPTERFLRVLDIVKQLEDGPYSKCESAAKSQDLVVRFHPYQPSYAEGNVDRMLEGYRAYVRSHFKLDDANPASNGIGYVLASTMAELYRLKGEGQAGLDRELDALEKLAPEPYAVRYLKALIFVGRQSAAKTSEESAPLAKSAATLLQDIHAHATGTIQRRALATLGSMYYFRGEISEARAIYTTYADSYPTSPFAWVASLRTGLCDQLAGNWTRSRHTFRKAVDSYQSPPSARFLARAYLGRAEDALESFDPARAAYQTALDAWDNDYGLQISLRAPAKRMSANPFEFPADVAQITKEGLRARVTQLARTTSAPGGATVERGRWLLEQGQAREAADLLGKFNSQYPKSANVAEARYLAHRAGVEHAFNLASVEKPAADQANAVATLDTILREPFDAAVAIAGITKACLLGREQSSEAERLMRDALTRLRDQQRAESSKASLTPLERDLAEIRQVVFKPLGDPIYGKGSWNAFSWPAALPPFVMANAEISVVLAGGETTTSTAMQAFSHMDNVVFVLPEHLALLAKMINSLGGTQQGQRQSAMSTPNQPVGQSRAVSAFLSTWFPVRPGHWSGWEFLTYPVVARITFLDEGRTKARASVIIGYSGADVILEKVNGVWKATGLTNQWMT